MGYNMGSKSSKSKNVEQEVFKVLEHQTRRNILKFIGEKKNPTFTDIIDAAKIADSPTLSYHLRTLAPFVERQNGSYKLTPIGQDAYSLLLKTAAYSKLVFHMGMSMTEEEHQKWPGMNVSKNKKLAKAILEKEKGPELSIYQENEMNTSFCDQLQNSHEQGVCPPLQTLCTHL